MPSPLDYLIGSEAQRAVLAIAAYTEHYTGARFDTFARQSPVDVFTATDIVAVEMLAVRVPARTSIWLLDDDGGHVGALLRQVGAETPIWSDALDLSSSGALWQLWDLIRAAGALGGHVVRSKLLAAKRPHAVPIYDQHVAAALGAPVGAYWTYWYDRLSGAAGQRLRDAAEQVAAGAGRSDLSVLRTLDVVIWMRQHGWKDMSGLLGDFERPIGT
jgi:hypothetical protein